MHVSKDIIIYAIVSILSIITFYGFLKIGVKTIAGYVTARPRAVILLSLLTVGLLGIGMKNLAFEPDTKMMLPEDCDSLKTWLKIDDAFGGIDGVYICVTAREGTIWSPRVLSEIAAISRELKSATYAENVLSITEAKAITNDQDMMSITDIVPENTTFSPAEIETIKAKVKANSMLYRNLVSKDEKSTLILTTINFRLPLTTPDGTPSFRMIRDEELFRGIPERPQEPSIPAIMAKHRTPATTLTITGFPYFRYDNQLRMEHDNMVFLAAGLLVMLGFLYLSFRTLRGMLLPLTIVVMGLIASFGFMGWMHEKITMPLLLMGPMLIAIAHNYGTQLIAKYYEDVQEASGAFTREAVKQIAGNSIISIGSPVMISAVTVIVGFVTMISHPISALAMLGILCAFGIIVSFILTIVLTPAILCLLGVPRMLIEKRHGATTDRLLGAIAAVTIKHRAPMLALVVVGTVICLAYALRIEVDANVMNAYPRSAPIYRDADFISDKFGGYSTLNVLVESRHPAAEDSPDDGPIKNPEILKWMEDFQKFALAQKDPETGKKLVGDALSLADYLSYMNQIMRNDPRENRVPDTRELIAQYLLQFENQGGKGLSDIVDFKYNSAQIILRLPDMSTARLSILNDALHRYIEGHPNPAIKVSLGGPVEIVREVGDMIIEGQLWSLLLSFGIIIICYMIFFRSLNAGLLAAIPLFCAVALVFGLMGLFNIPLDSITATLTGISIGVGTDYTAYFLWRLRERSTLHGNLEAGYIDTMTSIGKGILYNGLSVVVGFFVFLFSNFLPIRYFGFLISFSILACIISTLTILPVVVFMTRPRFLLSEGVQSAEDQVDDDMQVDIADTEIASN